MFADLRLPIGIEGFTEDTNDDEWYAFDTDGLADGLVRGSIELLGERLDDYSDFLVGQGVLIIKKPTSNNDKIAHDSILWRHAEQGSLLGNASANAHVIVELQHGRGGNNARDLVEDRVHVVERHIIGCRGVVWAADGTTTILELNLVGADARELVQRVLFAGGTESRD